MFTDFFCKPLVRRNTVSRAQYEHLLQERDELTKLLSEAQKLAAERANEITALRQQIEMFATTAPQNGTKRKRDNKGRYIKTG
jgi:hypothetical protein